VLLGASRLPAAARSEAAQAGAVAGRDRQDKARPTKQRHAAIRIFKRLKAEHGFSGCYAIVKDYVHAAELRSREMFVPLTHTPGEAQADWWATPAGTSWFQFRA